MLAAYRLLVGVTLLSVFALPGDPPAVGAHVEELFQVGVVGYVVLGTLALFAATRRLLPQDIQARAGLIADLVIVPLLVHASGGAPSGLGSLLIVSVGASSLILPWRTALLYAALATFAVLAEQTASVFEGLTRGEDYVRAGLVGGVTFLLTMAVQPMAQRLRESEALARQQDVDLANLAELNGYIIQHLRESIVVLDSDDTIRLINASAASQLGHPLSVVGQPIGEIYPALATEVRHWRAHDEQIDMTRPSITAADGATLLNPQFAPIGTLRPSPTLIFLEDATALAGRVQQTKLAALGRLSASIAHEIRNPIGAISHAGQLLSESSRLSEQEARLTQIIHDHCGRVNRIVKNVLQLSRRDQTEPQSLVLDEWLPMFATEFSSSLGTPETPFDVSIDSGPVTVLIDPSHLHQILWNLCSNAARYGQDTTPAGRDYRIAAGRMAASGRPFVEVLDRGPGIDDALRDQIFEPFFTRAKDGTGLGLYLARELCEVNRATLQYEPRDGGGSCFRIVFADPERWTD
ncbi:MAG: ATP-binding protein [Pseudomonadota bacterium]